MPLKIECPRCKARLQIPSKLAGRYVNCPQCKGRVWVEKAQKPAAPPPPPAPRKKVARFIAAEAADPNVLLAPDGKLPELHIDDDNKENKPAEAKPMSPMALLVGLGVAAMFWGILIYSVMQSAEPPHSQAKEEARQRIEREYFGAGAIDEKELKPYQMLLREAQMAHSRSDVKTERADYVKVLGLLHAERRPDEKGLTGSAANDKTLEDAIVVLLREERDLGI
jgi:DNA-directed RNA polymerase subunit RPC12/RpoP